MANTKKKEVLPLGLLFIPCLSRVHFPYNPHFAAVLPSELLVGTATNQLTWNVAVISFICSFPRFVRWMVWRKVPFTRCWGMEICACICEHLPAREWKKNYRLLLFMALSGTNEFWGPSFLLLLFQHRKVNEINLCMWFCYIFPNLYSIIY